ncbi:response regulator transcription factor [Dietzia sp. B32]|uniref:response regulator transcription factor n=1 Tax=Dietzia sp. B32 TaxID=2915130 RepID=UPI0021AE1A13|nr:response regulator [Dietzia sp. B32]UVE94641.1 response regulator [Dietzia sp. B32]
MTGTGPRVVIADDDDDIRELVAFKLENAGYEIRTARDGVEALEAITSFTPSLAILDIMMPGLSGLDVLRRLRDGEGPESCRVLLLTARARDAEVDAGFAAGADDYVIKPFSPRELLRRVDALLGR